MTERLSNLHVDGARIIFKNFEGREDKFNKEGDRNFKLVLEEPGLSDKLEADGWNVKYLKPREEGDQPTPFINVKVNFGGRPPKIFFLTTKRINGVDTLMKNQLDKDDAYLVDYSDIENVDVIVNPFPYDFNGNKGVAAYLQTIFITLRQDELELKYADVPELQQGHTRLELESGVDNKIEDLGELDVIEGELLELGN